MCVCDPVALSARIKSPPTVYSKKVKVKAKRLNSQTKDLNVTSVKSCE